ncbi:MAG: glycoside hydrolase, partial [Chitinophagaceae bacterium]
VMDQGKTPINGPHQGAWVDTKTGEHWFLHFQDKDAYGRVVHLQPMKWINDWPVIGEDKDGDGKGEPVLVFKKPNVGKTYPITTVADSDEFNSTKLGLQWQWQANPKPYWAFPSNGYLRLFSAQLPDSVKNYWDVSSLLMQKFPAGEFMVTTKVTFKPRLDGEKTGLIIHGADYAYLSLVKKAGGNYISFSHCSNADKGKEEIQIYGDKINGAAIYFRVKVGKGAVCEFSYSEDGTSFKNIGDKLVAKPGRWVSAKVGLFCTRTVKTNDSGYADVDWFRFELVQ